jgi:hypothetical protein
MQIEGAAMTYRSHTALLTIVSVFAATSADAANIACPGVTTPYVGIDGNGQVMTTIENTGVIGICSVSITIGGITPATCQTWYSTILTHRTMGKKLTYYFDTTNPINAGVTTCASLGSWVTRIPYFVELN